MWESCRTIGTILSKPQLNQMVDLIQRHQLFKKKGGGDNWNLSMGQVLDDSKELAVIFRSITMTLLYLKMSVFFRDAKSSVPK